MLLVPYKTDLHLYGTPWVSLTVIVLCCLIYASQFFNHDAVLEHAETYCESIHDPNIDENSLDFLREDPFYCSLVLTEIHDMGRDIWTPWLRDLFNETDVTSSEIEQALDTFEAHQKAFEEDSPIEFTNNLLHYPDKFNPISFITSSLSHADFWHLFFNLIFFIAFALALELLIDSHREFILALIALSIITSLSYSLSIIITRQDPVPTLGLSGIVMGMIGLSAYLIPHAKIGMFFWFLVFVKRFFLPVRLVSLWYIGWDTWYMLTASDYGGVNLVSHVSGGIGGYIIGMLYFKSRKMDISTDVAYWTKDAELERAHSSSSALYSGGQRYQRNKREAKRNEQNYEYTLERAYRAVLAERDSEAILILMEYETLYREDPQSLEALFERMNNWKQSRALLCMGRYLVHVLYSSGKYAWAYRITERCFEISKHFVTCDLPEASQMAIMAKDDNPELATALEKEMTRVLSIKSQYDQ